MTDPPLAPATSSDRNAAVLAGFLGWTLDAFDFFLLSLCLTHIAKTFNVSNSKIVFTIGLTLGMRPVGAFCFGLLADRYGRRRPLMINLVFYSAMSIASGLAPSYGWFVVFRLLFGIGMGGEWGVGASLAMEKVPAKWRGVLSGLLQEGYAAGNLLASGAYFLIFPHYGWRPLFLLGGAPALIALFVRFRVKESEVWKKSKSESWSNLGVAIASHWPLFLFLTLLMFMMNLASHGTQDMFPTLLEEKWHFLATGKAGVNAISMVGAVVGGVAVGLASDKIGRRRAMVLAFAGAIISIPLWAYAPNVALLIVGAFTIQFFVQGAWGVIPAHLTELSPDSVRGFLPGFAYQCGVFLAGYISYFQNAMKSVMTLQNAMALTAVVVFVPAALVVWFGGERRAVVFGSDD